MRSGYKKTEIGYIPDDWELISLFNLRNPEDRYSLTGGPFGSDLKSEHCTADGVPIIQLQNIGEGTFKDAKDPILTSEAKADQLKSCNIYPGEIILAKMAPVARSCRIPSSYPRYLMCSDGIRLAVDPKRFCKEYVFQSLNAPYFLDQAEAKSTGTTRARIGLKDLKQIPIAVPHLSEQRKIADILRTVDEKIEVIDRQILETENFKKGLMQRLFAKGISHAEFKESPLGKLPKSWEAKKIGDITKTFAGGTPKRSKPEYFSGGTIPWVKSGEVSKRFIDSTEEFITEIALKESSARLIPEDSLLIAMYGATAGQVGILNISACSNQAVLAVVPSQNKFSIPYLYYYLSEATPKLLRMVQGSGQPNLSKGIVDSLYIPLPPKSEQMQISAILDCISDKCEILSVKKKEYQQLKIALMQQLLTGQIRANYPVEA